MASLLSTAPFLPEPIRSGTYQEGLQRRSQAASAADETRRGVADSSPHSDSLRCGCYLINFTPVESSPIAYDGTLRVECHDTGRTASGDLYQRAVVAMPPADAGAASPGVLLGAPPNPAAGIPIFPRGQYRYYLRVTQIEPSAAANAVVLGFERYRFNASASTWTNEGTFSASMTSTSAPVGYPSPSDYLLGDLKDSAGMIVGRLTIGWVSPKLRKATIEIDRVALSEPPLDNAAGVNWAAVGEQIGWEITVLESESNLTEPSGPSWSDAECHAAMLKHRDTADLDGEWRFHVLAVQRLDSTPRGIMYDAGASDSDHVPREGCAISSHWIVPDDPTWGEARGLRFGTIAAAYFRTIVHETGHAMGLFHNTDDLGFMNTTDVIAAAGTAARPFPRNIQWSHAASDRKRLRHMPDIFVRPGGTPFGTDYATTPISADRAFEPPNLVLEVAPLLPSVPIGAPVRVNIALRNQGSRPARVPASISLRSGFTRGSVIGASGLGRPFSPLLLCMDEAPLVVLAPGDAVTNSLTLLRGSDGTLFPAPGLYDIEVEVHWDVDGIEARVAGEASMMVSGIVDEAHAVAALKVLETPDALLTLVFGGDHLTEGVAAISGAAENPVLGPHFAQIEAKRVGERFGKRKANLKAAAELLAKDAVMSDPEIKKIAKLAAGDKSGAKLVSPKLKRIASGRPISEDTKAAIDSL